MKKHPSKPLMSNLAKHIGFIEKEIRTANHDAAFRILEHVSGDDFEVYPWVRIWRHREEIKASIKIVIKKPKHV